MYRPDNWKNIRDRANPEDLLYPGRRKQFEEVYEAGADAMLEVVNDKLIPLSISFSDEGMMHRTGLDNQFLKHNWANKVREWASRYGKSRVVFIPEEK